MSRVQQPLAAEMTLSGVTAALARNEDVHAVAVVGSRANGRPPGSDIDLLVSVEGPTPRLWISTSYIDKTPADVFCVTDATLMAFAADPGGTPQAVRDWLHAVLPNAVIAHDRSGQLQAAVTTAQTHPLTSTDPAALWCAVNAEVIVIRRLNASRKRERELVATLPGAFDLLWRAYFACRRLPEMSHKQRVMWLDAHAPTFWGRWSAALEASHPARAEAWLTLAAESLEPAGGLWPDGTVLEVDGDSACADTAPPSLTQLLKGAR